MNRSDFDEFTIEPFFDEFTIEPFECEWAVYGHGTYEESSVLHGQPRRCFMELYNTKDEAEREFPKARVTEFSTRLPDGCVSLLDMAPGWFGPADAGEEW